MKGGSGTAGRSLQGDEVEKQDWLGLQGGHSFARAVFT